MATRRGEIKVITGGNQMSLIRDTEEVLKFLEFAARKGILNETGIQHRLTACHNLFALLNEDEDSLDFILQNLDVLVNRFRNKNPQVQASTLKVYKSRTKSSIEDFRAWSADPFAWERTVTDKAKAMALENRKEKRAKKKAEKVTPAVASAAAPEPVVAEPPPVDAFVATIPMANTRRVSFPIRPDLNIDIYLPMEGITQKELNRLGLFLYPYCQDLDADQLRWPS